VATLQSISPLSLHEKVLEQYCIEQNYPFRGLELVGFGANNVIYRFSHHKSKIAIKVGINPAFRHLRTEYEILKRCAPTTPGAVDFFSDDKSGTEVLLMRFIEGVHCRSVDVRQIALLGAAVAAYHRVSRNIPHVPLDDHRKFINGRIMPVNTTERNSRYIGQFKELYIECGILSESMPVDAVDQRAVLIHGDLIPRNIVFTDEDQAVVIDWEGARYDVPEADLATAIKGFGLDDLQTAALLDAYGLPVNRERLSYRLLLHYLQVIAWRCAVQLNCEDNVAYDRVCAELDCELLTAREVLAGCRSH
jgi:fructosamine-3-kinase